MSTPSTPASSPQLAQKNKQQQNNNKETQQEILTQWPSYDNLAKLCAEAGTGKKRKQFGGISGFFTHKVTITQKIDGSNLGCWVRFNPKIGVDKKDPKNYEVMLLQGRNQPIFRKKGFDEFVEQQNLKQKQQQQNQQQGKKKEENNDDNNEENTKTTTIQKEEAVTVFDENLSKKLAASLEDDLDFISTKLPGYGNCQKLQKIIYKMRDFCAAVAYDLGVDEIEVFGEAFRAKKLTLQQHQQKQQNDDSTNSIVYLEEKAEFCSFHPFGYKLPSSSFEITRLVSTTHQIFTKHAIVNSKAKLQNGKIPTTHEEFLATLFLATDHCVFPPPLFCENVPLIDGVQSILPLIVNPPDPTFEGVFIVSETGDFGCKFKQQQHSELKSLPSVADIGLALHVQKQEEEGETVTTENRVVSLLEKSDPRNPNAVNADPALLKRIYAFYTIMCKLLDPRDRAESKQQQQITIVSSPASAAGNDASAFVDKNWNSMLDQMNTDLKTACERELGKRLSFAHFEKGSAERQSVIEDLTPRCIKEVLEIYEESEDLKMPYTKEQLVKRAPIVVKQIVDAVEYQAL